MEDPFVSSTEEQKSYFKCAGMSSFWPDVGSTVNVILWTLSFCFATKSNPRSWSGSSFLSKTEIFIAQKIFLHIPLDVFAAFGT